MDYDNNTRFFGNVSFQVYINEDTLDEDDNIDKIRESNIPLQEKVNKAQNRARQIVITALSGIVDRTEGVDNNTLIMKNTWVNSVEMDKIIDRVDWCKLVSRV